VVEIPARVGADGAQAGELAPLAPELLGLVQQVKAYERLTVQAAVHGDRKAALKALLANPLVARYNVATALLDALLETNRRYLPRFFARG
jgi:6-phospho-beta-glucosidase